MFTGLLASELFSDAYSLLKKFLESYSKKLLSPVNDMQQSLAYHLKNIENWSNEISFKDLNKSKNLSDSYIPLNLRLTPKRLQFSTDDSLTTLHDILSENISNVVLLGQPGAGKTTSMKYICQELLHKEESSFPYLSFPIVIRLRELNGISNFDKPILNTLANILGLRIDFTKTSDAEKNYLIEISVINFIDTLHSLIIMDGFDELSEEKLRSNVIDDVRKLALGLNNSSFILTSRSADYKSHIEKTNIYEINSLSDDQILNFALKWLNSQELANDFLAQLKKSPFYDTTVRPLTLAHLCAIFERVHSIPEKPKSVYRRIVNLLLEDWNEQKSVIKKSRYSNFGTDRKFEFLSHLAYFLTVEFNKSIFNRDELSFCYFNICDYFQLPRNELNIVIDELESHNGIFLQSGYDLFEFSHKSLQEYFVAEYIIRLPLIPSEKNILLNIPNELAITISLSSNATKYFNIIIFEKLNDSLISLDFFRVFSNRLVLESPNFVPTPELGLALLDIYTLFTDRLSSYKNSEEYEIFLKTYANLFNLESLRKSIWEFARYSYKKEAYNVSLPEYKYINYLGNDKDNVISRLIVADDTLKVLRSDFLPIYVYHNPLLFKKLLGFG